MFCFSPLGLLKKKKKKKSAIDEVAYKQQWFISLFWKLKSGCYHARVDQEPSSGLHAAAFSLYSSLGGWTVRELFGVSYKGTDLIPEVSTLMT